MGRRRALTLAQTDNINGKSAEKAAAALATCCNFGAPCGYGAERRTDRNELLAFGMIEPEALIAAEALKDPEVFRFFALNSGRGLSRIVRTAEPHPLQLFAVRNVGTAILHEMALSGAEGDTYPPKGPAQMGVAPLARKFGVSRSHVMRLLRDAEKEGLLRRNSDEMTGIFEEKLREALLRFHASGFLTVAAGAFQAMNDANYPPWAVETR